MQRDVFERITPVEGQWNSFPTMLINPSSMAVAVGSVETSTNLFVGSNEGGLGLLKCSKSLKSSSSSVNRKQMASGNDFHQF